MTGCRYQELATLRPADVDLNASVLLIRAAKGGDARHVVLTDEAGCISSTAHGREAPHSSAFRTRSARSAGDQGLPRQTTRRMPWGRSHQFRPLREACQAAGIVPAVSFHVLRHTHASRLAMKGVPMAVIAEQLGHKDVNRSPSTTRTSRLATLLRRSGRLLAPWASYLKQRD